jgi:hypothetical protein
VVVGLGVAGGDGGGVGVAVGLGVAGGGGVGVGVAVGLGVAGGADVGVGVAAGLGVAGGGVVGVGVAAGLGIPGGGGVGVGVAAGVGVACGGVVAVGLGVALRVARGRVVAVGAGLATGVSSRPQPINEYSVPAAAALNPRATICRINSRRASAICGLPLWIPRCEQAAMMFDTTSESPLGKNSSQHAASWFLTFHFITLGRPKHLRSAAMKSKTAAESG